MAGSTKRNLLLVTATRIALMAMAFVGSAMVIRTLGPAAFGLYALCIAYIKIVTGCLGDAIDLAVLREVPVHLQARPQRALEILRGAFWLRAGVGVSCIAAAATFPALAGRMLLADGAPVLMVPLLAAGILGDLLMRSSAGYFQAAESFGRFLMLDAIVQLGRFASVVASIVAHKASPALILLCYVAWPYVAFAASLPLLPRQLVKPARSHRHDLSQILHHSKWLVIALVMAAVFERTDVLMLGRLAGAAQVGIYSAALTLALLPDLVTGCLSTVLFPKVSAVHARGEFARLNRQYLKYAIPVALFGAVCAQTLGTWTIETFFSHKYVESIPVFRIVVLGSLLSGVMTPLPSALLAFVAPRRVVVVSAIALGMVAALGMILIPRYGAIGAAVSVVLTRAAAAIIIVQMSRTVARRPPVFHHVEEMPEAATDWQNAPLQPAAV
jgi:O-antigen/teichoic acid export membrane protein